MKAVELERTFLVVAPPSEINGVESVQILDVYIPEGAAHSHLRLRRKGERYFITKKAPMADDVSVQVENTIELTSGEFDALAKCSNKRVEKNRYRVTMGGRGAEVDVFEGGTRGSYPGGFRV